MARAVAWWSESGGAGKTTNSMNSAAAIGRDGYDVLVWDLDPQPGSLTQYAGYENLVRGNHLTAMDVLFGKDEENSIHDVIVETEHFDLVPGHEDLGSFEDSLGSTKRKGLNELRVFREVVEDLADDYDFFIFDLPATLGRLVDNGLYATRNVMVPLELTEKGNISLDGLEETLEEMESGTNTPMAIMGVVPSRVGNANIFSSVREEIESRGVPVSPFSIPEHTLLKETWKANMDIFQFAESEDTREIRKYEKKDLIAFKVIGRIMAGDMSYEEAIELWEEVDEMDMASVDPISFMEKDEVTV